MHAHSEKTIIAQCTPKGSGAIALLRLSGSEAISIADKISKLTKHTLLEAISHTVHYGWIVDKIGNSIDQVMFTIMKAPKTFTGEDVVEITCHNNVFIIEQIILQAIENGARLAQPGEFAKRAFLNGKMDLLQAESINELINSHTQDSLKKSLSQLSGSFTNWINQIEKALIKCLALSEASFEFIDDEMEFGDQILLEIQKIKDQIKDSKRTFNNQQQIKEGIRIAIIGSVNAGKSSLFNVLLKKNRAIVSDIPGTTRDSIEAGIYTKDHFMTLVDTAGLRQTDDKIEQEGISRSTEEAQKADIILLVQDGSKKITTQEENIYLEINKLFKSKTIFVVNKCDLANQLNSDLFGKLDLNPIEISTTKNLNIDKIEQEIELKINAILENCNSPFLLNKRQFNLLTDLVNKLDEITAMLQVNVQYELLSIHINEALQSICELTGKTISEKAMDAIFKEFCIGK